VHSCQGSQVFFSLGVLCRTNIKEPCVTRLPHETECIHAKAQWVFFDFFSIFFVGNDIKEPFVKRLLRKIECLHAKARRLLFGFFRGN